MSSKRVSAIVLVIAAILVAATVSLTGAMATRPSDASARDSWDFYLRNSGPVGIQYMRPVVTLTGDLGPSYLEPIVTLTSDSALGHR